MKFYILLLSLIIHSINCSDLKLENLCENDVFDYENQKVNSFIRYTANYTLPVLNNMLLPSNLNFDDWSDNKTLIKEIYAKQNEYNDIIKYFYTDKIINKLNATQIFKLKTDVIRIRNYFRSFSLGFGQQQAQMVAERIIFIGNYLLSKMYLIKNDQLNEFYIDEKTIVFAIMNSRNQLANNGRLAFDQHKFYQYYAERIIKFDPIKLYPDVVEVGKVPTFSLTLYLPVSKFNYNSKDQCTKAINLPTFFKENSRSIM